MADFAIKKGDTRPVLTDSLTFSDGSVVNLTGATVTFVMRSQTAIAPQVNAAAVVTDAPNGRVSYSFVAGDTATAGQYMGEWHVVFSDGSTMTFPTDGYLELIVEEDLVTPGGGRIVNLGEVKEYLNVSPADRTHDAKLLRFIDSATPIVESICGPVLVHSYSEIHDGGQTWIMALHTPLLTVEACTEYRGPIPYTLAEVPDPAHGTVYSVMWEPWGRVQRRSPGGGVIAFPAMPQSVLLVYTAGYLAIPANITHGTLELIRENYQPTQQALHPAYESGGDSEGIIDDKSMGEFFVSDRVREMLASSRRIPSIV